jgi:hypothetical protein
MVITLAICVIVLAVVCLGLLAAIGYLGRRLYRLEAAHVRRHGLQLEEQRRGLYRLEAAHGALVRRHGLQLEEQRRGLDAAARLSLRQSEQNQVFHARLRALERLAAN